MAKLYSIFGCMGSGKSEDLIRVYNNYTRKNLDTLVLKSSLDTRDEEEIKTRKGDSIPCITVHGEDNIYEILNKYDNIKAIIVDEAQFLDIEQVNQLWEICTLKDIPVFAYFIKINYKGEGFKASERLLTLSHDITEIKTICDCGSKATHHLLKVNHEYVFEGDDVVIGDSEFSSVCDKCWLTAKNKYDETNRTVVDKYRHKIGLDTERKILYKAKDCYYDEQEFYDIHFKKISSIHKKMSDSEIECLISILSRIYHEIILGVTKTYYPEGVGVTDKVRTILSFEYKFKLDFCYPDDPKEPGFYIIKFGDN